MAEKESADCCEQSALVQNTTNAGEASSTTQYTPTQPPDLVRVLKITPARVFGEVKAFVTVQVGEVVISGIRVIMPANTGRPRMELPMQQSSAGELWPLVRFANENLREAVHDAVMASWRDMVVLQGMGGRHGSTRR